MFGINNLKGKKLFESSCYATKDVGVVNIAPGSPLKLREYQEEAVDIAINNQCSGINIPTGAGKTHIALSSFLLKKKQNNNLRLIVAVPQNDIGENFTKKYYYSLKGENYEINKAFSFYDSTDGKLKQFQDWFNERDHLKSYLLNDKYCADYQDAIVVTHQLLVKIKDLFAQNILDNSLIKDLFIVIDEAHHGANSTDQELSNKLAQSLSYFIENGASVQTLTATEFRSDGLTPAQSIKNFVSYTISIERTLPYTNIKSITLHLLFGKVEECIKTIYSDLKSSITDNALNHSIIYLQNSGALKSGKNQDILTIKSGEISKIIKSLPVEYRDSVVSVIGEDPAPYKDLFDKDSDLAKNTKIVLAQNRMKEGTDWVYNDTVVILGMQSRGSLSDLIQMIGRSLRKSGDEDKHVNIFLQADPAFVLNKSQDEVLNSSRQYIKNIVLAMLAIIDSIPNDFKVKSPKDKEHSESNEQKYTESDLKINSFVNSAVEDIVQTFVINGFQDSQTKDVDKIVAEYVDENISDDLKSNSIKIKEKIINKLKIITSFALESSYEDLDIDLLSGGLKSLGKIFLTSSEPISDEQLALIKERALNYSEEANKFIEDIARKWSNIKLTSGFKKSDKMSFKCTNCTEIFKRSYDFVCGWIKHAEDDSPPKKSFCNVCNPDINYYISGLKQTCKLKSNHQIDWDEISGLNKQYNCFCKKQQSYFPENRNFFESKKPICPLCKEVMKR